MFFIIMGRGFARMHADSNQRNPRASASHKILVLVDYADFATLLPVLRRGVSTILDGDTNGQRCLMCLLW